jgi:hypothetical protein
VHFCHSLRHKYGRENYIHRVISGQIRLSGFRSRGRNSEITILNTLFHVMWDDSRIALPGSLNNRRSWWFGPLQGHFLFLLPPNPAFHYGSLRGAPSLGSGGQSRSPCPSPNPVWTIHFLTSSFQPWRWRQYGPPKYWYVPTSPHGVATQKTQHQQLHFNLCGSAFRYKRDIYNLPK